MVIETLNWMHATQGIEQIVVPVTFPVASSQQLIDAVATALAREAEGAVKICVFSHISSMPTLIEPVAELAALCHRYNAVVLVDGAHAPGVLDIDVHSIGADYYTGNCHKWLYAPKVLAHCLLVWLFVCFPYRIHSK